MKLVCEPGNLIYFIKFMAYLRILYKVRFPACYQAKSDVCNKTGRKVQLPNVVNVKVNFFHWVPKIPYNGPLFCKGPISYMYMNRPHGNVNCDEILFANGHTKEDVLTKRQKGFLKQISIFKVVDVRTHCTKH